jgi:hypothetical protein
VAASIKSSYTAAIAAPGPDATSYEDTEEVRRHECIGMRCDAMRACEYPLLACMHIEVRIVLLPSRGCHMRHHRRTTAARAVSPTLLLGVRVVGVAYTYIHGHPEKCKTPYSGVGSTRRSRLSP